MLTSPYVPSSSVTIYAKWAGVPFLSYNSSDLNSYDSSGTTVTDLSGNSNTGSAVNGLAYSNDLYSWNFAGGSRVTAPYVDVPNLSSNNFSNGFTVDFEANFGSTADSYERIIDFGESGANNDNVFISRNGTTSSLLLRFYYSGSTSYSCIFTDGIVENTMTRYTITKDANYCRLYRSGLTWTIATTYMQTANLTYTDNFIGKSNWNDPSFEGQIRSIRIYSNPFTQAQIDAFSYKTLTFDSNGGSATGVSSSSTSGKLKLATTPTKAGYSFAGWFDASSTLQFGWS